MSKVTLWMTVAAVVLLMSCSHKEAPSQGAVTAVNSAANHAVEVFWTAQGCDGMDINHHIASICHRQQIPVGKSATYVFEANTSNRMLAVFRYEKDCGLPYGIGDAASTAVKADDVISTDGCTFHKQ
jgi:hypothetical protein